MKALIIGGTGPTGPHIVKGLLQRGYEVSLLHRGTHELDMPSEVEHIHADPHFLETLEGALGKRTFDIAVATYGRLRLTSKVLQGRVSRMISVGSMDAYRGWFDPITDARILIPTPENAPRQTEPELGKFSYRIVEAENTVMEGHRNGYYNATHFRYPMVYGPHQLAPLVWCIVRRILDGRKRLILPDAGLAIESRGYSENVAHALLLAVDKPREAAGQIYNVRDETLLSLLDWVNTICRVMSYSFEFVEMPYCLAGPSRPYGASASQTVTAHPKHRVLDISKIKQDLGYQDIVPTEKGIELTVKWYLENPPEPGGETEKQLGDTFDYAAEDLLMDSFLDASSRIKKLAVPHPKYIHPYAHPKHT